MAVEATCDAIPCSTLANLVGSTVEFQRAVGVSGEAAAKAFIHFIEAADRRTGDGPKAQPRPRAIIEWASRDSDHTGTGLWVETGTLMLTFELLNANLNLTGASNPPTFQEQSIAFLNFYGTVLGQMKVNVDQDPNRYLNIQHLTLFEGPCNVRQREEEFWGVVFEVSWF